MTARVTQMRPVAHATGSRYSNVDATLSLHSRPLSNLSPYQSHLERLSAPPLSRNISNGMSGSDGANSDLTPLLTSGDDSPRLDDAEQGALDSVYGRVTSMPRLGSTFPSRPAFEEACKNAVPPDVDWTLRVWKSMEAETAARYGKHAFVELGCTHTKSSDPITCSSTNFRIRATRQDDGNYIVVKSQTAHDSLGPPQAFANSNKRKRAPGSSAPPVVAKSAFCRPPRVSRPKKAKVQYEEDDLGPSDEDYESEETRRKARIQPLPPSRPNRPTYLGPRRYSNLRPDLPQPRRGLGQKYPSPSAYSHNGTFFLPQAVPRVDAPTYCYCHYTAYDNMIKCAGEYCKNQWFHLGCIGLPEPPSEDWQCYDCRTLVRKPVRTADMLVNSHANALNMLAAATLPVEENLHGPMVAFLNSLNPTLGDAVGQKLVESGLTSPWRFQGMTIEEWEFFHDNCLENCGISNFDAYTLKKTITAWLARDGYTQLNKWSNK